MNLTALSGIKISCLCVTFNRVAYLQTAIACFKGQTHINKEIIVVYEDTDLETVNYLNSFKDPEVVLAVVNSDDHLSLGEKRNYSVALATGSYFCQWDDDDWYHEKRLEFQLSALLLNFKPACFLAKTLLYNELDSVAYVSHYTLLEGSALCCKEVYNEGFLYENLSIGEDTPFLHSLIKNGKVFPLLSPTLYIYRYHGRNTWHDAHFTSLFSRSDVQKLPQNINEIIIDCMSGKLGHAEASGLLSSREVLGAINY